MISDQDLLKYSNYINPPPTEKNQATTYNYKYWNKQPVPKINEIITKNEIINNNYTNIPTTPTKLPNNYTWCEINIIDNNKDVSNFLSKYYSEDVDSKFMPQFSGEYLKSFINPFNNISLGLKHDDELIGFIMTNFVNMKIHNKVERFAETNYLCVHPKYRKKNIPELLITEITRKSHMLGVHCGFFTGTRYLPKPFCTTQHFARPINVKYLIDNGYMPMKPGSSVKDIKKILYLSDEVYNENFVEMKEEHISHACNIVNKFHEKYSCSRYFSLDEFKHHFYDNKYVVSYVLIQNNEVVDLCSYYKSMLKVKENNKLINVANLYYFTSNKETPFRLVKDMLTVAKIKGADLMVSQNIMNADKILDILLFEKGAGNLYYYFYNWYSPDIMPYNMSAQII